MSSPAIAGSDRIAEDLYAIAECGPTFEQAIERMRAFSREMARCEERLRPSLQAMLRAIVAASHHRSFVVTDSGGQTRRVRQRLGGWSQ